MSLSLPDDGGMHGGACERHGRCELGRPGGAGDRARARAAAASIGVSVGGNYAEIKDARCTASRDCRLWDRP